MFAKVQLLKSYGFPSRPYEYSNLSCSIFPTKRFRAQKGRFSVSPSYSLSKITLQWIFGGPRNKIERKMFLKKRQTHVSLHQWAAPSTPSTTPKETFKPFCGRRSLVFTAVGGLSWPRPGVCFLAKSDPLQRLCCCVVSQVVGAFFVSPKCVVSKGIPRVGWWIVDLAVA